MKKLSDTYKKIGIKFSYPIEVKDDNGNRTYYENSNGYWEVREHDDAGNITFRKNSKGDWIKRKYDSNGNETYYETSSGFKRKREYDDNGHQTAVKDNLDHEEYPLQRESYTTKYMS